MNRLAAIDIGTNSIKITVADADAAGALHIVRESAEITRLGAGVDAGKRLDDDAVARTLAALSRFAADARALGAADIVAAGTSALRDAANGPDFLVRAQNETGLIIEIISGDREAQLAYSAVRADPDLGLPSDFGIVVFDIGGGSTELSLGGANGLERHVSLDIGAVRVTERFLHSDPPTDRETAEAVQFLQAALAVFPPPDRQPILVGIGGSVVNIGAVTLAKDTPPPNDVHGTLLFASDAQDALSRFAAVPLAERRSLPGLEPARADVIIGGALILNALLAHFHSDRFLISARGLRYGLLAERAQATQAQPD